jgi:methionyl-tRNA formyltransferase
MIKRILFLGNNNCNLFQFLKNQRLCEVIQISEKISKKTIDEVDPDLVVSYGYRYILKKDIIEKIRNKVINLHIAYLPWNRGADPNLWSILDGTNKGVTIHMLNEGIDTGDILFQKKVDIPDHETLSSSYNILKDEIELLFIKNWKHIFSGDFLNLRKKQNNKYGSFHLKKQGQEILKKLKIDSWDITLKEVKGMQDELIINEIQDIRSKNNTHWMDLVRLSFKIAPKDSRDIFKKIKYCDQKINELLKELSEND